MDVKQGPSYYCYDGNVKAGRKEYVVYFAILRMPDSEPELLESEYVFTDDVKKLERKLRYTLPRKEYEAEHLEIVIRPISGAGMY